MANDLQDHFARVAWVRGEITRLEDEVSSFLTSNPVEVVWSFDLGRYESRRIYKLVQRAAVPKSAQIRAGSIINEMRSVLDSLACTLSVRNGNKDIGSTYFPTGKSQEIFDSANIQKKIKNLSDADKALIRGLKPYPGGNDLLYTLHSSDIIRKHQRLILFASGTDHLKIGKKGWWSMDSTRMREIKFNPGPLSSNTLHMDLAWDYHIDLAVVASVSFAEPDYIKGKPIIATLNEFADLTETVLKIFD